MLTNALLPPHRNLCSPVLAAQCTAVGELSRLKERLPGKQPFKVI